MIKKMSILLLLIIFCFTGCGNNPKMTEHAYADLDIDTVGTYEWVSPDGVHYWVFNSYHQYGIAPRIDRNGNYIIDKED